MKILWLTDNYPPNKGGMAQSCDRIVYNLRRQGLEIHILHLTQRVKKLKIQVVQQGQEIYYPAHPDIAHTLNCMWIFLEQRQQKEQYTHLVAFGGYFPMFAAPLFAALMQRPLLTLLRGNDFDAGLFTPRKQKILEDCLKKSALICTVSSDKKKKIEAIYPGLQVVHIPNGIDLAQWQALPSEQQQAQDWRNRHVAEARKVIGLFGHLKDKKGINFFLEQVLHLQLEEAFHFLVVGELSPELQTWLQEVPLHYTHYPFMERFELLAYYPACDAVAIPSFYDGMPNVLLEAGGLGIPLIASRVAGMADVLQAKHAFLFEAGNAEDCRRAIFRLYETEIPQLQAMGQDCKAWIATHYHEDKEAQAYLQAFRACN